MTKNRKLKVEIHKFIEENQGVTLKNIHTHFLEERRTNIGNLRGAMKRLVKTGRIEEQEDETYQSLSGEILSFLLRNPEGDDVINILAFLSYGRAISSKKFIKTYRRLIHLGKIEFIGKRGSMVVSEAKRVISSISE